MKDNMYALRHEEKTAITKSLESLICDLGVVDKYSGDIRIKDELSRKGTKEARRELNKDPKIKQLIKDANAEQLRHRNAEQQLYKRAVKLKCDLRNSLSGRFEVGLRSTDTDRIINANEKVVKDKFKQIQNIIAKVAVGVDRREVLKLYEEAKKIVGRV